MNKFKLLKLIELIKVSAKAKIVVGVVGVAVAGTAVAGGVAIYNKYNDKPAKVESMASASAMGEEAGKEFEKDNKTNSDEYLDSQKKLEESKEKVDSNNDNKSTEINKDDKSKADNKINDTKEESNSNNVSSDKDSKTESSNDGSKKQVEVSNNKSGSSKVKEEASHKKEEAPKKKEETSHKKEEAPKKKEDTPKKEDNSFKGFYYSIGKDGSSYDKVGGENDYAAMFPQVSNKSTVKGLVPDVNRAVQVLTQGAYESKVKSKFLGKTYNGKKIVDVQIQYYEIPCLTGNELTDMNKELKKRGAFNTPGGQFASVLGEYTPMNDSLEGFVKCTVILN